MKKILLSMLTVMTAFVTAGAQSTDLSALTDAVYVEPQEVPAGSQQTLSVRMKNSIEVQTIQFDLYLPEGLTVVANKDLELMTASKARISKFSFFQSSRLDDGALRLLAQATTTNIAVGDGEIATVIVSVPADMLLGDYPITVKNILLVSKENVSKAVDEVTTKITVVEPQDSRVVLDETSTTAPDASNGAVDVLVKRTIKANEWSTICLPFEMNEKQLTDAFGEDVQLAEFDDYEVDADGNIIINFESFGLSYGLMSNYPYIIKTSKNISEFTTTAVIDPNQDDAYVAYDNGRAPTHPRYEWYGKFIGVYQANTVVPENSLFISGNKFWYSTGNTKMKAFRGYFLLKDVLSDLNQSGARISFNFSEATGILDNNRETITNNRYYDLQGRRVEKPGKGLYIRNGKKEIVK